MEVNLLKGQTSHYNVVTDVIMMLLIDIKLLGDEQVEASKKNISYLKLMTE